MTKRYPGTTIEVLAMKKGSSRLLFDGIFAAGGVTLSQVSNMTGLEPYLIQNWVKRKFVSSPVKKLYSREQFARIIIINMLRESLQIDSICNLLQVIGGEIDNELDDLIKDDELYHRYCDMVCDGEIDISDKAIVSEAVHNAAQDFEGKLPADRQKLVKILQIMLYAHTASKLRDSARELLSPLQ